MLSNRLQFFALILTYTLLTGCQLIPERLTATTPPQTADTVTPAVRAMVTRQQAERASTLPPNSPVTGTLWPRIRSGMRLAQPASLPGTAQVARERRRYLKNVMYLNRIFERAEPFLHLIVERIEGHRLPAEFALLPVVESGFRTTAYSRGHASGLWQFIPATGSDYGLRQNWWYDGRRDVSAATDAAIQYLKHLHRLFDGNWLHALAAYNAGQSNVLRAIRHNRDTGRPTDFWHLDLPRETRNYIPRLLAISAIVRNPGAYGVTLTPIANRPRLTSIDAAGQIDLDIAANLAGMETASLKALNPGFKRWATPPAGPHTLLIPIDRAPVLQRKLAGMPPHARLRFARHRVARGDVLGKLAKRYDTTVTAIRRANRLRSTIIRIGQNLLIPTPHPAPAPLTASKGTQSGPGAPATTAPRTPVRIHVVVRGDTLWDIARQYTIRLADLIAWNRLDPNKPLRIASTLRLSRPTGRHAISGRRSSPPVDLAMPSVPADPTTANDTAQLATRTPIHETLARLYR